MSTTEKWRAIPSLPEYEASSLGRLRRKVHEVGLPNGGVRKYGGHAWVGTWDEMQGRYIIMYRGKTYRVARLVCEAFHGPAPENKPYCLHKDEDARNNRPGNLKWGTQKENLNAPGFITYCKSRTGDKNPYIKGRSK